MSSTSITEIAIALRALVVVLKYYWRRFPPKMYLSVSPYTTEHPLYLLAQCRSAQYGAFSFPRNNEVQYTNGFAFVNFQQREQAVADWKLG